MDFNQALGIMKKGFKVTRPCWNGYWYWNNDKKTVIIHTKDGKEFDLFDSDDKELTLSSLSCRDFRIVSESGFDFTNISSLQDTINLMISGNHKERFKAEYYQLKIRYEKLREIINKYNACKLDFKPTCPIEKLEDQLYYMNEYMRALEVIAEIEGIKL